MTADPGPPPPPAPAAPVNSAPPAIELARSTLPCASGEWVGDLPITFTYEWLVNDVVAGTGPTFPNQLDVRITCRVTASNAAGQAAALSNGLITNTSGAPAPTPSPGPGTDAPASRTPAASTGTVKAAKRAVTVRTSCSGRGTCSLTFKLLVGKKTVGTLKASLSRRRVDDLHDQAQRGRQARAEAKAKRLKVKLVGTQVVNGKSRTVVSKTVTLRA